MLTIPQQVVDDMQAHAVDTYPHECCGFLVGQAGKPRRCRSSVRATNQRLDRAQDRYEIDPREWLRLEKRVGDTGEAIIGIYHSHPDHPSRPSEFDREHAHPHMSYVILETTAAGVQSIRSWTLDGAHQFHDEGMGVGETATS